jgi:ABC-type lipoprotein release transport system permease subunit
MGEQFARWPRRGKIGLVRGSIDRDLDAEAVIGAIVSFAAPKTLNAAIRLEAIDPMDFGAFAAGFVLVMAATALAAYHPALRAARVDPSQTLLSDA